MAAAKNRKRVPKAKPKRTKRGAAKPAPRKPRGKSKKAAGRKATGKAAGRKPAGKAVAPSAKASGRRVTGRSPKAPAPRSATSAHAPRRVPSARKRGGAKSLRSAARGQGPALGLVDAATRTIRRATRKIVRAVTP